MSNYLFAAALAAFAVLQCRVTHAAPIDVVFVHGLAGFGPDELSSINYWGFAGKDLLKKYSIFPSDKFTTHEASVGPVSSNWDRACELYAQITGTRVDYGAAHSKKHSHERFGKTYAKGFVEDWGPNKPISLVGHSMGGQTIRMLELLLNEGSADEVAASGADVSPLFRGGHKGWIRSLTTIATPHDGTTAVSAIGSNFVLLIKNFLLMFGAFSADSATQSLYDFDLDQHGLGRKPGESQADYNERVFSSSKFTDSYQDFADYDLSLEGAAVMNAMGPQAYPETTYFAFVCDQTYRGDYGVWFPTMSMQLPLYPTSLMIGAFRGDDEDDRDYSNWRANDGLVPVLSQTCPKLGAKDPVHSCVNKVPASGQLVKGKWYQTAVRRDHANVIGISLGIDDDANDGIFRDLANQILSAGGEQDSKSTRIAIEDQVELDTIYGQVPFTGGPSGLVIGLATVGGLGAIGAGVVLMRASKAREAKKSANTATVHHSFTLDADALGVNKGNGDFNPALDL
jgi:triacylglycerol lipase